MVNEYVTLGSRQYKVIEDPCRHIVVVIDTDLPKLSSKQRLLISPFNGCSHRCLFCFKNEFFTNVTYKLFREKNIITVFKNLPEIIARQSQDVEIYNEAYISLITDPFQPLNRKYRLSENIMQELNRLHVPYVVCTKGIISGEGIEHIKKNTNSFVEISVFTLHEKIRKQIVRGDGATLDEQFTLLEKLQKENIKVVARVEPIYPYVTDDFADLEQLIDKLRVFGVREIISAVLKIPEYTAESNFADLAHIDSLLTEKYRRLYNNKSDGLLIADSQYRKNIFSFLEKVCARKEITLRICMESLQEAKR